MPARSHPLRGTPPFDCWSGSSPIGRLLVVLDASGRLCEVAVGDNDEVGVRGAVWAEAGATVGALPDSEALALRIVAWLDGNDDDFADVEVVLDGCSAFQREVLTALRGVVAGETTSYGELADRLDRHGAARAVGTACGANPVPIVIPCHRVIAADGSIGGWSGGGGLGVKRQLLARDGIVV